MANQVNNAPDYGNWVSKRLVYTFVVLGVVFLALAFLFWVSVIPALLSLGVAAYFAYARYLFSPKGGNVQNKIWETVMSNLDWNGEGKALDIGCGNGALTIRLAHKFTEAQVTGIDYWGERWEYSKSACEANAKAESVNERVVVSESQRFKTAF